jgi:thiol-disulfide isomerase/thioredoxin
MKKIFITMLLTVLFIQAYTQNGYEIKVKVANLRDSAIILGHHFAKSMYPDDTVKLDKTGTGVFKGKEPLPQGIYIVFLPNKSYFDIIVAENQHFSVENDTNDLYKNIKFKNSVENQIFYDYQYFLGKKRDEVKKFQEERKNTVSEKGKTEIADKLKAIDNEVKQYKEKLKTDYPDKFVTKFIIATQDIEVPDPPRDEKGNITDSMFQYRYYRAHYFDNFDISDPRMLRTPLYEDKVITYIDKVVPQIPDSINPEVDMLIAKSRATPELFRYMLVTLFNHFGKSQIMGFDNIALYIADKYYIKEATWSDTAYIRKLKKQIVEKSPTMIGKIAPEIDLMHVPVEHFMMAADDTAQKRNVYAGIPFKLSSYIKDYTILYFWDTECGHCKKETPIMRDVYKRLKDKNVQLIAVALVYSREGMEKWTNFVNENKLYEWVNAFYPYSVRFKELYDVSSTPSIFIMDANRKIIAKRISAEQCEEIINHEIELKQRKNK